MPRRRLYCLIAVRHLLTAAWSTCDVVAVNQRHKLCPDALLYIGICGLPLRTATPILAKYRPANPKLIALPRTIDLHE